MPPPLLTDWEPVRATAIATGSLKEAAIQHGVKHGSVRQRARRENWPVGTRPAKAAREAKLQADLLAHRARAAAAQSATHSAPVQVVTHVTTASAAIEESFISSGKRGRIALGLASAKAAEHLADQDAETIVGRSRALKDIADVSAKTGGWGADDVHKGQTVLNIAILSGDNLPDSVRGNYILPGAEQSADAWEVEDSED